MSKINFYYAVKEEFPFVATYDDWTTPPVNPRLGYGGVTGHSARTYGMLIRNVLNDLRWYVPKNNSGFPELVLSDKFKEKIGSDLELFTRGLLSEGLVKLLQTDEDIRRLFDEGSGFVNCGCNH